VVGEDVGLPVIVIGPPPMLATAPPNEPELPKKVQALIVMVPSLAPALEARPQLLQFHRYSSFSDRRPAILPQRRTDR
jgi:hypothetical protein